MKNRGIGKVSVIAVVSLFVAGAMSVTHVYPASDTKNVISWTNQRNRCSKKVNAVLNASCYSGSDIGAQIMTAKDSEDCAPSGCRIRIPVSRTCYQLSTHIVLDKYVMLEGDPSNSACLQYTGTSGSAITLDWGSSHHYGAGLRDLEILGKCATTACKGNTSVGIVVGLNNGAEGARIENVKVGGSGNGFYQGIALGNPYSFVVKIDHTSAFGNAYGFYQSSSQNNENIVWEGGCVCQNAYGTYLRGFGDFNFDHISFDDNTTAGQDFNGSLVVHDTAVHFENAGLGTGAFINSNGNTHLTINASSFTDDRTTGTSPYMVNYGGTDLQASGNTIGSAGITVATWINPTGGNTVSLVGNKVTNNVLADASGSWTGATFDCPVEPMDSTCLFRNYIISTNVGVNFIETSAPGSATGKDVCYGDTVAHQVKCSYNNGSFYSISQTIGSGTSTSNGTAIAPGTSQAQPAITVTGATTSDTAACSLNAPYPPSWQTGIVPLPPVVTANTVTPWLSNPTDRSIIPAATAIRCTVLR
ncbi:MAG: hypothetical protein JWO91_790 [Acidobacteriaceae bacterium]|nr:hypothetical protein [Acidobacteriaceae bacterium]